LITFSSVGECNEESADEGGEALLELGLNPLMVEAFRDRSSAA